jgi:hypothetical protein
MKADLASLDAVGVERRQHPPQSPWSEAAGLSEKALALVVGAGLAMTACGIVAAALWLAWHLAEILQ